MKIVYAIPSLAALAVAVRAPSADVGVISFSPDFVFMSRRCMIVTF